MIAANLIAGPLRARELFDQETNQLASPLILRDVVSDSANFLRSVLRKLGDMSALFSRTDKSQPPSGDWLKESDRRSAPTVVRLRAGLFLRYHSATGATEFDTFLRDAKTWAVFEHAVLPELDNFTFFDTSQQRNVSSSAALADAMLHLWTATELGLDLDGRPTTISVIGELASYLCAVYQTRKTDRRTRKRNWLGLNPAR